VQEREELLQQAFTELKGLECQLSDSRERENELRCRLDEHAAAARTHAVDELTQLQTDNSELHTHCSSLVEQLGDAAEQLRSLHGKLGELELGKAAATQLAEAPFSASQTITDQRTQIDELQHKCDMYESEKITLQSAVTAADERAQQARATIDSLNTQVLAQSGEQVSVIALNSRIDQLQV
jgi:chromosome segregation ATPase